MKALITGGAGYIGGTVASACLDAGIQVVVLDDLSSAPARPDGPVAFYHGDIADDRMLERIVAEHPDLSHVVHCAARIVVPESVADPLAYYDANVGKSVAMLRGLSRLGLRRVIFSSSASVYRGDDGVGVDEDAPLHPGSPYATSKAMVEQILADAGAAGQLRSISLRYFNPIGADPALRTGPSNPEPSHVVGRLVTSWRAGAPFTITGTDWPTRDGSGVRDFIHVWDLATAHVAAITRFDAVATAAEPSRTINVGSGTGTTVRELVAAFQQVVESGLEVREGPARPGDGAGAYAITTLADRLLDWRPELTVQQGIRDALAWADRQRAH